MHLRSRRGKKVGKALHVPNCKIAPKEAYDKVWARILNGDGDINERMYTIPYHAWISGWYHPRRLADEDRLNDAEKAKLLAVHKHLARLQVMWLHEQLEGDEPERVKKAFAEACEIWLEDRSWLLVSKSLFTGQAKAAKGKPARAAAILEWAKKGLTKKEKEAVSVKLTRDAASL